MTHDLSFFALILQASLIVQLVMLLLLGFSMGSWWCIFIKWFQLRDAKKQTELFEQTFWSGTDFQQLIQKTNKPRFGAGALARICSAGFQEFNKLRAQTNAQVADVIDGSRRAMRAAYQRELDDLEAQLPFLATVGSVSPYIGLFGTVWGIMHAFRSLANVGQATLAQVAPGIAEALIATAIGLFAAIPAVIAFNRFNYDLDRLDNRFESFIAEFSNVLQRQIR